MGSDFAAVCPEASEGEWRGTWADHGRAGRWDSFTPFPGTDAVPA